MKILIRFGTSALLAGVVLGLGEGLFIYLTSADPKVGFVFSYGATLYGVVGTLFGLFLGIIHQLAQSFFFRPKFVNPRSLGFTIAFWVGAFLILQIRIKRDLFEEGAKTFLGLSQTGAMGILLILTLVSAFWTLWILQKGKSKIPSSVPTVFFFSLIVIFNYFMSGIEENSHTPLPTLVTGQIPSQEKPNVILIVADTLRADHVSAYARLLKLKSIPVKTPAIDSLAENGVLFLNAIASSSWTKPSFASFFTGLYPSTHNTVHKLDRLPNKVKTLAEILSEGGYLTSGFPNNPNISSTFNFQQGFHTYRYLKPNLPLWAPESGVHLVGYRIIRVLFERYIKEGDQPRSYYWPAEDVNKEVFPWLKANARNQFFLMIHYMDPHDPYFFRPLNNKSFARIRNPAPRPSLANRLAVAYAQEVKYLDKNLAKLFDFLKQNNLYENTMILLISDHGEEFFEHNGWWHGTSLYEEQIHVPMIIKFRKGKNKGRIYNEVVQLLDIPPTVLDEVGLPRSEKMQGRSLAGTALEAAASEGALSELNLEGQVMSSYRENRWKWIEANPSNPRGLPLKSLFDLKSDPREQKNLLPGQQIYKKKMRRKLKQVLKEAKSEATQRETVPRDPAMEERLKALGYID